MNPHKRYDMSGIEILLIIITIACMRGCHHAGQINERQLQQQEAKQ